jgi:hypothetical protein
MLPVMKNKMICLYITTAMRLPATFQTRCLKTEGGLALGTKTYKGNLTLTHQEQFCMHLRISPIIDRKKNDLA